MRVSAQRRFQRSSAGRRRLLPDHHAQRRALLDRGRLSQVGATARQSQGGSGGARHAHSLRWPTRDRRRVSCRQRQTQRARQCRGDRRFGSLQFAAASAAFGDRTGVAPAVARNRRDRRCSGRRRRSQRPFFRPHHFALQGTDHAQRCGAQLERKGLGTACTTHSRAAVISPSRRSLPDVSCARIPRRKRPTPNARLRCSRPTPSVENCIRSRA